MSNYVRNITAQQYQRDSKASNSIVRDDAHKDILHKKYLKILESDIKLDSPHTYMYEGVRLLHLNHLRTERKHRTVDVEVEEQGYTPEYLDKYYLIYEAIDALPDRQKQIMLLHMQEICNLDIAVQLGMHYDTVKANYRHGMLSIKKYLKKHKFVREEVSV